MTTKRGVPFWKRELIVRFFASPEALPAAGLGLLILLLFYECVLFGRVLYEWDIHLFWHSQAEGFVRTIASGALPLWNPSVAFGRPMLADANAQVFYPPTWLHMLLPSTAVHLLLLLGHCVLTAAGMFRLARRLDCRRAAAWTAAGLWLASGPLLSLVYVWNHFSAACWIPWILLAAERVRTHGSVRDCTLWAAGLALPVVTGSPDVAFFAALASAIHVGAATLWPSWRANERAAAPLLRIALAGGLALGLSAAQWMPSSEVAAKSTRAALSAEIRTSWSVHPPMLAQTLAPVLPSSVPLGAQARSALFQSQDPFLESLYLGLPALALVIAALAGGPANVVRVAASLLAVFVAFALGRHLPGYEFLSHVVFPLRMLRYPEKAMIMVAFFWALLSGLGLETWTRSARTWTRLRRGTVFGVALLPTLLVLAAALCCALAPQSLARSLLVATAHASDLYPTGARLACAGLAAVAVLVVLARGAGHARTAVVVALLAVPELALMNRAVNPAGHREIYASASLVASGLRADGAARVYVYDYLVARTSERYLKRPDPYRIVRLPAGWNADETRALAMRLMLFPPSSQVFGLDGSYDIDVLELYPRWLTELVDLLRAEEGSAGHRRLLQLAGVDHVLALHEEGLQDLELQATVPTFFPEPLRVFRVPSPLPRAYAVTGARVAAGAEALAVLRDPAFRPEREVLVPQGEPRAPGEGVAGTVRVLERRPDRLRLDVELAQPGFVVVLDGYDEGWHATVDGRSAPVLRANVAFRAVAVDAGTHLVEQVYRPAAVTSGALVSLAACALAVGLALRGREAAGVE